MALISGMSEWPKGQDGRWSMSGAQVLYENVEVREGMCSVFTLLVWHSVWAVCNSVRTGGPGLAVCRAGGLDGCEIPLGSVNPTAGSFLISVCMWPWSVLGQGLAPVTPVALAALSWLWEVREGSWPWNSLITCHIAISFSISMSSNYIMFSCHWKLIDYVFWVFTVSATSSLKNRSETTLMKSNFQAFEPWLNLEWCTISIWWMIQVIKHFCVLNTFAYCMTLVVNDHAHGFIPSLFLFEYTVWNYYQAIIFYIYISLIWDKDCT